MLALAIGILSPGQRERQGEGIHFANQIVDVVGQVREWLTWLNGFLRSGRFGIHGMRPFRVLGFREREARRKGTTPTCEPVFFTRTPRWEKLIEHRQHRLRRQAVRLWQPRDMDWPGLRFQYPGR